MWIWALMWCLLIWTMNQGTICSGTPSSFPYTRIPSTELVNSRQHIVIAMVTASQDSLQAKKNFQEATTVLWFIPSNIWLMHTVRTRSPILPSQLDRELIHCQLASLSVTTVGVPCPDQPLLAGRQFSQKESCEKLFHFLKSETYVLGIMSQ